MSTSKRDVPWFKTFAASDMAAMDFWRLSAGERGMVDSMKRACWVDGCVPSDPRLLARVLRLDPDDASKHLTDDVLLHFTIDPDDEGVLRSPEIDRQKADVAAMREKQRAGGKVGAEKANRRHRGRANSLAHNAKAQPAGQPVGQPVGQPAGQLRVPTIHSYPLTSTPSLGSDDPFVRDYEQHEELECCDAQSYRTARQR